jgi:excisionase family DNA binding protein
MNRYDGATTRKIESMLTVTEASRLLNVHPNTLRRWSNKGIIKTYRIGSRADRRFLKNDIDRFLSLVQMKEEAGIRLASSYSLFQIPVT